ncbi:MAG: hypothetical protein ACRER3_00265 [Pseudomonas fluorescens]
MTREKEIPAPAGYPLFGWTWDTVKAHLQEQPPNVGEVMIIYNGHGGFHSYSLATVVNPAAGRQKRIVLSKAGSSGGTSFHRSGINAVMPKGRTRMIPSVPALMEHLTLECDVVLDLSLNVQERIL